MKRLLLSVALTLLALPSGLALAAAGDDQYCDPFTGCAPAAHRPAAPRTPTPAPTAPTAPPVDPPPAAATPPRNLPRTLPPSPSRREQRLAAALRVLQAAGLDAMRDYYLLTVR